MENIIYTSIMEIQIIIWSSILHNDFDYELSLASLEKVLWLILFKLIWKLISNNFLNRSQKKLIFLEFTFSNNGFLSIKNWIIFFNSYLGVSFRQTILFSKFSLKIDQEFIF